MQNSDFWTRITSLYGSQPSSVVLCIHNSDIMTIINRSLTSPVVLGMQNNVISITITSLYGSQPSFVFLACKTAAFGSELQVSKGPSLRLSICECKTACWDPEWRLSIGSSLHLWFLHAKQRLLDQNCKSLWVPDFTNRIVHAKQRD